MKTSGIILVLLLLLTACAGEELNADAGDDFSVVVGDVPTFDACDSTGDIENYSWVILTVPASRSQDNGKVIREVEDDCEFILEDTMVLEEAGEWVVELTVRNEDGDTDTDTVTVTVLAE